MGSGIGKKAHDKAVSALDRIVNLERAVENLWNGTQQSLMLVDQKLQQQDEMVTAIVNILGAEVVRDQVVAQRKAEQEARLEAAKDAVEDAVERQLLLPLERFPSAEEMSAENDDVEEKLSKILVVGRELEADGTVTPPGRVQQPLNRILPGIRASLASKSTGDSVDLPEGRKFTVDGLYIENPNPPPAATPEGAETPAAVSPEASVAETA